MKLVLPEFSEPWIAVILERIQSEVIFVEGLQRWRVNSNGDRADRLQLVVAHHILPIRPTVAADNQEAVGHVEAFDGLQHTAHRHALAEANDDPSRVVLLKIRHQLLELLVLVVAENLRERMRKRKSI